MSRIVSKKLRILTDWNRERMGRESLASVALRDASEKLSVEEDSIRLFLIDRYVLAVSDEGAFSYEYEGGLNG